MRRNLCHVLKASWVSFRYSIRFFALAVSARKCDDTHSSARHSATDVAAHQGPPLGTGDEPAAAGPEASPTSVPRESRSPNVSPGSPQDAHAERGQCRDPEHPRRPARKSRDGPARGARASGLLGASGGLLPPPAAGVGRGRTWADSARHRQPARRSAGPRTGSGGCGISAPGTSAQSRGGFQGRGRGRGAGEREPSLPWGRAAARSPDYRQSGTRGQVNRTVCNRRRGCVRNFGADPRPLSRAMHLVRAPGRRSPSDGAPAGGAPHGVLGLTRAPPIHPAGPLPL